MKKVLSILLLATVILGLNQTTFAQETGAEREWGTITTAVPFLMIGPDARSGGMGDVGAATTPDGNSIYWNASKLAFVENSVGFNVSYVPWLKGLVDDIGLGYVSGYGRINDKSVVSASLRYFSLGSITFTNDEGVSQGTYKPNEFAVDVAYARQLSKNFSAAVTGKFIYSNLTLGQDVGGVESRAGTSVAADVTVFYTKPLRFSQGRRGTWGLGGGIYNIGNKISYTSSTEKDFIPTNLKIGTTFSMDLDDYNFFSLSLDFNKLLVPTPPVYYKEGDNIPEGSEVGDLVPPYKDNNVSPLQGMIQSFYDAPFKEELQEINIAVGAEYWYDKQFALRGGYFYESPSKGNRQYFTLGAGLRYNVFGLDFSYLIATNPNNPLKNTLRFTLTYDIE
ncbi:MULTISPECIES: type IX secretion system outer membrane channel protein PorV [unclassified Lentimicrobium]|uniref:type IX secretion system outer membrane channel protein PorV n=1 Tax=unclassified Lentimicrobium TaxID=2677434 RepID=UPI001556C929|nr:MULTISPECIES: type IX secretion system outer membrane channel protein PorV [unclassified Lentimicrobium]NPD46389.1 type IX secretion system outer membrane channel protein PorV [Lentimicrobium sp. S6]NPD83575.1 type IX secretion system outer membrane channel protein PorV [Lentimicrobium sp. L6]